MMMSLWRQKAKEHFVMSIYDEVGLGVFGLLYAGLFLLSMKRPNGGRVGFGVLLFLGSLVNYTLSFLNNPGLVQGMVASPFIPWYKDIALSLFTPRAGLFFFLVATYELTVALLLVSKGKAVKLGFVGGILFFLGVAPLALWSVANLLAAATLAFLLARANTYDQSLLDLLRAPFSRKRTSTYSWQNNVGAGEETRTMPSSSSRT
jgi:hypothetical protein